MVVAQGACLCVSVRVHPVHPVPSSTSQPLRRDNAEFACIVRRKTAIIGASSASGGGAEMRRSREAWASGRGKLFVVSLIASDRPTEISELRSAQAPRASGFGHSPALADACSIDGESVFLRISTGPLVPSLLLTRSSYVAAEQKSLAHGSCARSVHKQRSWSVGVSFAMNRYISRSILRIAVSSGADLPGKSEAGSIVRCG